MDELEHVVADINWIRQIAADGLRPSESAAALAAAELPPHELHSHPVYAHYSEPSVQVLQKFVRQPLGFYFLGVYCQRQARELADWLTKATKEPGSAPAEAKLALKNESIHPSACGVAGCIHFLFALSSVVGREQAAFIQKVCSVFLEVDCPLPKRREQLFQLFEVAEATSSRPVEVAGGSAHRSEVVWYARQVATMLLADDDAAAAAEYCRMHSCGNSSGVEGVPPSLGNGANQNIAESNFIQLRGPVVNGLRDAWVTTTSPTPPQTSDPAAVPSRTELASLSKLRDILLVRSIVLLRVVLFYPFVFLFCLSFCLGVWCLCVFTCQTNVYWCRRVARSNLSRIVVGSDGSTLSVLRSSHVLCH